VQRDNDQSEYSNTLFGPSSCLSGPFLSQWCTSDTAMR
jgi:hypothetical protein